MQKLERTPFKTSRVAEYFDAHELEYIECKLEDKGVRDKLIPPDEALRDLAPGIYRDKHAARIDALFRQSGL